MNMKGKLLIKSSSLTSEELYSVIIDILANAEGSPGMGELVPQDLKYIQFKR